MVGHLPYLDDTIFTAGSNHVVVVRTPGDVEHGGLVAHDQRHVAVRMQGGPAVVQGDPFLLRQALVNLLDNAADFAPEGSAVDVDIDRHDARWRVTVADRGPGVPAQPGATSPRGPWMSQRLRRPW